MFDRARFVKFSVRLGCEEIRSRGEPFSRLRGPRRKMVMRSVTLRQRCSAAVVVLGISTALACGATRNVIDDRLEPVAGEDGQGAAGQGGSGGGAGGSMGGSSGTLASAGRAGLFGGSDGSGGHVVTWNERECHATPVAEPTDPTAREQWSLARAYCATLGKQDCFAAGVITGVNGCTSDEKVDACVAWALWFHTDNIAPECEDAWRKVAACGATATFAMDGCQQVNIVGLLSAPAATCAKENAALEACAEQSSSFKEVRVAGSYTECLYAESSATACDVRCPIGPYSATLACRGPEGLPKQCGCQINGHVMAPFDPIFVNDCADAAQQAADGLCTGQLDCCFVYADSGQQSCMCTDPTTFGYDTCQAMMDFGKGQRVDICPGLLPGGASTEGGWPPRASSQP